MVGCGGGGGGAPIIPPTGGGGGGDNPVETLRFTITDVIKEMVTHQGTPPADPANLWVNPAECYFWVFKENRFPEDAPGPQIYAFEGDLIALEVKNDLDLPHSFFIPGRLPTDLPMVDTGPIAPGETWKGEFTAGEPGTYLYHDNLNAPVNRVMGLHGAFVVLPTQAAGANATPYGNPTAAVQQLFDDFGSQPWWPGLAWGEGDAPNGTPPYRQYVWLTHQASPRLFEEVGLLGQGPGAAEYSAAEFVQKFTQDPFVNYSNDPRSGVNADYPVKVDTPNYKPAYFTINGQSGFFGHHNPAVVPFHRVGEPTLVRILNAGLWLHSMHLHANHFFVTAIDNVPEENPKWLDVHSLHPMEHLDYVVPFMRPPDIPNQRGIGRADAGLTTTGGSPTWPPFEELDRFMPEVGTTAPNGVSLAMRQSPLCYPMHDHSEPSQTANGGNYNCGLIAGMYIMGDRTTGNGADLDFPMEPEFEMMFNLGSNTGETGNPAGNWPDESGS